MELGIWEFAKVATVCKERWGRDWNLEYGNFEFARRERFITRNKERRGGAGIGIWNLGIIEFARSAGGRDWNLEFGNFEFEKRLKYQSG